MKREEKKENGLRRFSEMKKAGRGTASPPDQPAAQAETGQAENTKINPKLCYP